MGFLDEVVRWATTGGGVGDPADTPDNIKDFIDEQFENFADFYTDGEPLPPEFEPRANGVFSNLYDLTQYLARGGLILEDVNGNIIANPIVAIRENVLTRSDGSIEIEYQVAIGPSDRKKG